MATGITRSLLVVSIFYLLVVRDLCNCQQSLEAAKCTQYKRNIFERNVTFSFFMIGAPETLVVENNCRNYSPFIVEGKPAEPKEFPLMARIGVTTESTEIKWVCGGTLISERFVLTAAHCFYPDGGVISVVRLGELDFSTTTDDADPEDFGIKDYYQHPKYNENQNYYDIGLVELDRPVKFNAYKHPACLPVDSGDRFNNLVAIGWGSTKFASQASPNLLKVKLDKYSYDYCNNFTVRSNIQQLPNGIDDSSIICAGSLTSRSDTCNGDSGGPLLAYHTDYPCMYFVIGVTSLGDGGCGNPGAPGIYTRVYHFMDWIKQYIWK